MIRAHEDAGALTLVVEGPATMTESAAVSEAVGERLRRGARAVRLDLRDCTTLDSTFTGTLLSLDRQLEAAGGTLTLVSPSPRVVALLQEMGLEDFYAVEQADRVVGPWTDVPLTRPGADRLSRMILDAHEQLARVPGAAESAFRAVVEEMRREEPKTLPAATKPASRVRVL